MKLAIFNNLYVLKTVFHFEEWLKYHIDFGVDHFYFYENTHPDFLFLKSDTKRDIKVDIFNNFSYKDIYSYYNQIKLKYKDYCTFIKWLPTDSAGLVLGTEDPSSYPGKEPWVPSQNAAARHFYQNYAQKYDRVSTIDFDEFYFSERYNNIKDFLHDNEQDILLLGCKFLESVFINVNQGLITQKTKCLDKYSRVGPKYIFNPQKRNRVKACPHFPPSQQKNGRKSPYVSINPKDLCFYHYKLNKNAKVAIEHYGKQKMRYAEDTSMSAKSQYLQDYNFIKKPEAKKEFTDSDEDVLGLTLLDWSAVK